MVAHDPLHGSGRADFPHPALASGDDAKPPQGIGVTDAGRWQPAVDEPPHALPEHSAVLATPTEHAVPESADRKAEGAQGWTVHGHAVVADVSPNDRPQPIADLGDGVVHASPKLGFHVTQLRLQPLADRLPENRE